jgi:hypothetical protein
MTRTRLNVALAAVHIVVQEGRRASSSIADQRPSTSRSEGFCDLPARPRPERTMSTADKACAAEPGDYEVQRRCPIRRLRLDLQLPFTAVETGARSSPTPRAPCRCVPEAGVVGRGGRGAHTSPSPCRRDRHERAPRVARPRRRHGLDTAAVHLAENCWPDAGRATVLTDNAAAIAPTASSASRSKADARRLPTRRPRRPTPWHAARGGSGRFSGRR